VTSKCGVGCEGCYLNATPDGSDTKSEQLETTLDALERMGVFTVAFGGGEPTLRKDLAELAAHARKRGIVPLVTTSGIGLTPAKIDRLRAFEQVNVSYDGATAAYEAVRGVDRAAEAESAIRKIAAAGIRVGVNIVLTRASFPSLATTLERAADLGAIEAQLLRYKPQGRARSLDYFDKRLSRDQVREFPNVLETCSKAHQGRLTLRIDCALVPFLATSPRFAADPTLLQKNGIFGCEAGRHLGAVRADGRVAPCSFADAADLEGAQIDLGFDSDPTLSSFRTFPDGAPEPCASCAVAPVCRGGCKVVTSFVAGTFGPDPECPRVIEAAARS